MNKQTTDHYDRIKTFMKLAEQDTPDEPIEPSFEIRKLRAILILEEALETIEALGFEAQQSYAPYNEVFQIMCRFNKPNSNFNMAEVIDGCIDISVVTMGTLIACGVPDVPFLKEVDQNNLDKIRNGTVRKDGKLIKHPDHKPPKIKEILSELSNNFV